VSIEPILLIYKTKWCTIWHQAECKFSVFVHEDQIVQYNTIYINVVEIKKTFHTVYCITQCDNYNKNKYKMLNT